MRAREDWGANWRSGPAKTGSPSLKCLLTSKQASELLYVYTTPRNAHPDVGAEDRSHLSTLELANLIAPLPKAGKFPQNHTNVGGSIEFVFSDPIPSLPFPTGRLGRSEMRRDERKEKKEGQNWD